MKKYLFFASLFVLLSCSSESIVLPVHNIENTTGSPGQLKTVYYSTPSNPYVESFCVYFYQGNKLERKLIGKTDTDKQSEVFFEYEGDLISQINYRYYHNPTMLFERTLTYDDQNRLIEQQSATGNVIKYDYLSNTSVEFRTYQGNSTTLLESGRLTLNENNEVIKATALNNSNPQTFTYDDKASPIGSLPGFDKLLMNFDLGEGKLHNIIARVSTPYTSYQVTYTYNNQNKPLTAKYTNSNKQTLNVRFVYF